LSADRRVLDVEQLEIDVGVWEVVGVKLEHHFRSGLLLPAWCTEGGCALDEPVADAAYVDDPAFAVVVELAAEAAGVAIECAGGAGVRVAPEVDK
jgi:hypothetical protein